MDMNTLWFFILAGLLAVYVVLDGYDLGIGVIHLFTGDRKRRERFLALVGPRWDGNEVWLIIAGGVLFAIFPRVYAALLSGFYPYFVVLLFAFIVRGLAVGLHDAYDSAVWRRLTDVCFGVASLLVIVLVGIVGANLARGVPTDKSGIVRADLGNSLDLSALCAGFFVASLLAMHGALYTAMKSEADQQRHAQKWAFGLWTLTLVLVIPAVALNVNATASSAAKSHPVFFALVTALLIIFLIYIPWTLGHAGFIRAFLSSCLSIALFLVWMAMLSFPRLMRSAADDSHSLTIYNAAATHAAMSVTLIIIAIAIPLAVTYSVFVHVMLKRSGEQRGGY